MPIDQFTVSYNEEERGSLIENALKEFGVVVITDVFSPEYCNEVMTKTVGAIQALSPTIKVDSLTNLKNSWIDAQLMPQTRAGLFQRGYSSLSWDIRGSPVMTDLFSDAYSRLRGRPINDLVTSLDGINIKPPIPPFHDPNGTDWAHLDQTESLNPFECIQGQVVLTNSTAGFRCSPKSHLLHKQILTIGKKVHAKGNWFKFSAGQEKQIRKMVLQSGGEWQIPVIVPQGSVIFWLSSTVHSAKLPDNIPLEGINPADPWDQWRGVFYVCHRPKEEVNSQHLHTLQDAFFKNRSTNHWGSKMFPKTPFRYDASSYAKHIDQVVSKPTHFFQTNGVERVEQTEQIKSLLGMN